MLRATPDPLVHSIRFHDFPVVGIEPMTACTARSFPRHTHDQYGIGVIDSGGHASWSGRGQVRAGPGALICVNPGEVHDGHAIGKRPRHWRLLYIEPTWMAQASADVHDGKSRGFEFPAPVFNDERTRRLIDGAFACTSKAALASDLGLTCETVMLTLVARLHAPLHRRPANLDGPTGCIRRCRERIDADPAAHVTLADLAEDAGLSRYQLIRAFAGQLGITPHAYILQRRIALARRLIRACHPLAEVAAVAGFADQAHLTRCFKRYFGLTPRRYGLRTA
jgi:AraC-like DNA-binding protein